METKTIIEKPKTSISNNIRVSEFIYPDENIRSENYHIFLSITGENLDFNERQKEMIKVFIESMKEELLTP